MAFGKASTKQRGQAGERLALGFLKKKGFRILKKNYRNTFGEIDIVAEEKGQLVFVEVRTLKSWQRHLPEETVGPKKQQKISRTAMAYIQEKGWEDRPARFDVIAVKASDQEPAIHHIPNAFDVWE